MKRKKLSKEDIFNDYMNLINTVNNKSEITKFSEESLLQTTNITECKPIDKLKELELEIQFMKNENLTIAIERDKHRNMYMKYHKMATDMAEEVIILRNQLDKFLNYKK